MEKKTTKKVVKKSATKKVAEKSAPKKVIKKKNEVLPLEDDDFEFFNMDIPRAIYARLCWTYFKMYIKSFFRK